MGRHTVSAGASPQAVMEALVATPLAAAGLGFTDIDVYSSEMQNPEATEPAGAGDVPTANYKMMVLLRLRRDN